MPDVSILTSIKKNLGLAEDYTAFDPDLVLYINGVFARLNQLGIGPAQGYSIADKTPTWDLFLEDDLRLNSVKTYMTLRVRLLFDPPATSFVIAAMEKQIEEHEWTINVVREEDSWTDPLPVILVEDV